MFTHHKIIFFPLIKNCLLAFLVVFLTENTLLAQQFKFININLYDVAYSPVTDRLYGVAPGSEARGNAILVIHPATGAVESRIPCGSEPEVIQISDNGQVLFIGMLGTPLVRRYSLATQGFLPDIDIEEFIGSPSFNHYPVHTGDLKVLPGSTTSFLLAKKDINTRPDFFSAQIYDGTTPRSQTPGQGVVASNEFAITENGQTAWAIGHEYEPQSFTRYNIDANGLNAAESFPGTIAYGNNEFTYKSGRLYVFNGQIFDVSSGTPTLLTTLETGQAYGNYRAPVAVALDSASFFQITDFNAADPFVFNGYHLKEFNQTDFTLKRSVLMPKEFIDVPSKFKSLGNGRLAFLAKNYFSTGHFTQLVLFNPAPCPAQNLDLHINAAPVNYRCEGDTMVLTADAGYSDYLWSNGERTQSVKVTAYNSLYYKVVDANGCLSEPSDTVQVLFETRPSVPVVQYYNYDNIMCPGETVKMSGYSYVGNAAQYVYSTGDTLPPSTYLDITVPGTYSIYGISAHGCQSPLGYGEVHSANSPAAPPAIEIIGNTDICPGESVVLRGPANVQAYIWSNGSALRELQPTFQGNYSLQVMYENGCTSPVSAPVYVRFNTGAVRPQVEESFFTLYLENLFDMGDSVQWYLNGQAILGANDVSHVPVEQGIYTIKNFDGSCVLQSYPHSFTNECKAEIVVQNTFDPSVFFLTAQATPNHDYSYIWSNGHTGYSMEINTAGTYCVTVTRGVDNCTNSACVTFSPNNELLARAYYASDNIEGLNIVLSKLEPNGDVLPIDSIISNDQGKAFFQNINEGTYLLQAIPTVGTPLADVYHPTFHFNALFWGDADFFELKGLRLSDSVPVKGILMREIPMFTNGPGMITGNVTGIPGFWNGGGSDGGFNGGNGPLPNISIILYFQDGSIRQTYTDANGDFSFNNLPLGLYTVYLNYPGHPSPPAYIELTVLNPNTIPFQFLVSPSDVTIPTQEVFSGNKIRVWPNPTQEYLYVNAEKLVSWRILDPLGRIILKNILTKSFEHKINVTSLPSGLFWIYLEDGENPYKPIPFIKE